MQNSSTNLSLPLMLSSQTKKHAIFNDAIVSIDNLLMLSVLSREISSPPPYPNNGDRYIISANATDEWATRSGQIAAFNNLGWTYYPPKAGFICYVTDESAVICFDGNVWRDLPIANSALQNLQSLGIGTSADTNNNFAAKANGALFTAKYQAENGTGDVRVKLNKESTNNNASFLFQNNWSGRAEFGLTGNDDFSIKVSPDGTNWNTVLCLDKQSGRLKKGIEITENISANFIANLPSSPLRLISKDSEGVRLVMDSYGGFPTIAARAFGGTSNSPSRTTNNQRLLQILGFGHGATTPFSSSSSAIVFQASEDWSDTARGANMVFYTTQNGTAITLPRVIIDSDGSMKPFTDNSYSLGSTTNRFATIYSATGVINTSDQRDKIEQAIVTPKLAMDIISKIEPKIYKWKVGKKQPIIPENGQVIEPEEAVFIEKEGKRNHAGFFAQDVKAALDEVGLDLALWGLDDKENPNSKQWLRSDQMIPILWAAVRELIKK